ncbi:MAG: hypothetical protein Q8R57_10925 [Bacteroidota bacterium]|nr:hypothetical protein [Bacteroidota bacterium]
MLKPSFHKRYELSNHASTSLSTGASISLSTCLGNVLAVISDRKLLVYDGDSFLYNIADVTNATDYSPFGAPLPGRVYNTPTNITSDTTAWIKGWEPSTVSTSYVGNRLKVDVSTLWAGIRRSIKTVPGHNYVFKTTVDLHTAGSVYIFARRMSPNNTSGNIKVIHTSVSGTYEVHFTALDTITYLHVEEGGSYTSGTVTFYLENTLVQDKQLGGKSYRFGFNGQEKDDEVSGAGNTMTAEFWEYDTRLGRRWNCDPVDKPWMSSYHAFSNKPVLNIDPNGANDGHYVDEETGKYLGEDGADNEDVRVIKKSEFEKVNDPKSEEGTKQLENKSNLLSEHNQGIRISEDTWKSIESNGGSRLTPWLTNNSDFQVFFKPEGPGTSIPVNANQDVYARIDGVAAPHLKSNEVFKATDFVRVTIDNKSLNWNSTGSRSFGTQLLDGGWKNETWLNTITADQVFFINSNMERTSYRKTADHNWINLYKSSGIKDADKYKVSHSIER